MASISDYVTVGGITGVSIAELAAAGSPEITQVTRSSIGMLFYSAGAFVGTQFALSKLQDDFLNPGGTSNINPDTLNIELSYAQISISAPLYYSIFLMLNG